MVRDVQCDPQPGRDADSRVGLNGRSPRLESQFCVSSLNVHVVQSRYVCGDYIACVAFSFAD